MVKQLLLLLQVGFVVLLYLFIWRVIRVASRDMRAASISSSGIVSMADVYLATDQSLGRKVAIKILSDRYARDAAFVERFRREAAAAASLRHPNIVTVYDRGEAMGTSYIAMSFECAWAEFSSLRLR